MCRERICTKRGSSHAVIGLPYVRIRRLASLPRVCLFLVGRLSHGNASFHGGSRCLSRCHASDVSTVSNGQWSDPEAEPNGLSGTVSLSMVENSSFAHSSWNPCCFPTKMLLLRDQVTISPTNLSPVISICSIVCLLLSTLSVAGRVFTKAAVVRRLAMDDFAILSATVRPRSISNWALLKMYG